MQKTSTHNNQAHFPKIFGVDQQKKMAYSSSEFGDSPESGLRTGDPLSESYQ